MPRTHVTICGAPNAIAIPKIAPIAQPHEIRFAIAKAPSAMTKITAIGVSHAKMFACRAVAPVKNGDACANTREGKRSAATLTAARTDFRSVPITLDMPHTPVPCIDRALCDHRIDISREPRFCSSPRETLTNSRGGQSPPLTCAAHPHYPLPHLVAKDLGDTVSELIRTDDPEFHEYARRQIVKRLLSHHVRPALIYRLTCYSTGRVVRVRDRANLNLPNRPRGPTPKSLYRNFFRTSRLRLDADLAAKTCEDFNLVRGIAKNGDVDLDWSVRLLQAYEAFHTHHPHSTVTCELLALLATELAVGQLIELRHCTVCNAPTLLDRLSKSQDGLCEHHRRATSRPHPNARKPR